MGIVAKEIRGYYFWMSLTIKFHLVSDNTRGHGANKTMEEYSTVKHQTIPSCFNSPEMNLLDLGIWFSILQYSQNWNSWIIGIGKALVYWPKLLRKY